ncbi:MAG TPA: DUF1810 domain-containing protein [Bryobacteraceae bacterium]|nr:DUF1810 domain-containing protein [Bryobacteraceae bacterium]
MARAQESDPVDPYNLQRFVAAQNPVYDQVRRELREGLKRGHWMWFIFPQVKGLGHSEMALIFGIASLDEAKAYLSHAILGPRLLECTQLVMRVEERTVQQIFGDPDELKFRSCMTLFAHAATENTIFKSALRKYCGNEFDQLTVHRLRPGVESSEI